MISERHWSSLIEKDSHHVGDRVLILDFGQALLGMCEHGNHLIKSHAGKPFQELINGGTCFQVFEECPNGHASSPKNPRAAHFVFGPLDRKSVV